MLYLNGSCSNMLLLPAKFKKIKLVTNIKQFQKPPMQQHQLDNNNFLYQPTLNCSFSTSSLLDTFCRYFLYPTMSLYSEGSWLLKDIDQERHPDSHINSLKIALFH